MQEEFEAYLKCGRFEHGFLRMRSADCHAEKLVAFSCKRRGFCPNCGARRMTESTALLADEVLPQKPLRRWVLSLPFALRFLLATDSRALTRALGIVNWTISAHILRKVWLARAAGATGAAFGVNRKPFCPYYPQLLASGMTDCAFTVHDARLVGVRLAAGDGVMPPVTVFDEFRLVNKP